MKRIALKTALLLSLTAISGIGATRLLADPPTSSVGPKAIVCPDASCSDPWDCEYDPGSGCAFGGPGQCTNQRCL